MKQIVKRHAGLLFLIVLILFFGVGAGGWVWFGLRQDRIQAEYEYQQLPEPEQQYQSLMGLIELDGQQAPDFTLTDQNGETISLSSLRGKVVVLEFMDPQCTDVCPVVSQEFIKADSLLGKAVSGVEFLAVNVNQFHESEKDVMEFSQEQGLDKLPNWHFLTGTTAQLQSIWKAYDIAVTPNPTGDVEHTSSMYFIDGKGTERYLANPDDSQATISEWAKGISVITQDLE